MSYNKSLLSGGKSMVKMLINPISTKTVINPFKNNNGMGGNCDCTNNFQLSDSLLQTLNTIENSYVYKMAHRQYTTIPNDMFGYLTLNDTMLNTVESEKNNNLKLLFQIALDGLTGALNSKSLSIENADLEINLALTQKKLDDILSKKNEINAMHGETTGEFSISKTFKLAPLYSYYIHLYGMPEFGVGFDPKKLSIVKSVLAKHGIV